MLKFYSNLSVENRDFSDRGAGACPPDNTLDVRVDKLAEETFDSEIEHYFDSEIEHYKELPHAIIKPLIKLGIGLGALVALTLLVRCLRRRKSCVAVTPVVPKVPFATVKPMEIKSVLPQAPKKLNAYGIEMSNVRLNGKGSSLEVEVGTTGSVTVEFDYRQLVGRWQPKILIGDDKRGYLEHTSMDTQGFTGPWAASIRGPISIPKLMKTAGPLKQGSVLISIPKEKGTYAIQYRYAETDGETRGWWGTDGIPGKDAILGYLVRK